MLPFLWDSPDLELVHQYFWLLGKMYFILYFLLLSSSHRRHTGTEITPSQTEKCPMNTGDPMGNTGSLGNNQWAVCCPKNASASQPARWCTEWQWLSLNGDSSPIAASLLPGPRVGTEEAYGVPPAIPDTAPGHGAGVPRRLRYHSPAGGNYCIKKYFSRISHCLV